MPVLLLDEATSSLDPETEAVVRKVIEEEFRDKGHTVIEISHRVTTRGNGEGRGEKGVVVWLDKGRVAKVERGEG